MQILTIHGIRRREKWYEEFKDLPVWKNNNIEVISFEYGYFTLWQFLNPWSRNKVFKKFQKFYSDNCDPKQPPSVICHSFGSYIFYNTIKKYSVIKFDKVLLCGSILSSNTEWRKFFEGKQIGFLYNDYGQVDIVVKFSALVIKGCGKSGQIGFNNIPDKYKSSIIQKNNYFNHSDYFLSVHMRESWVNLLLPEKKFNYKSSILRKDVMDRIYSNMSPENISYSKIDFFARIDEKGNYYARYAKTGINNTGAQMTEYPVRTTADAIHSSNDMCFYAFDIYRSKLLITQKIDEVQNKLFVIHLNRSVNKDEHFSIVYKFRWKETITSSGDTDHFEIRNAKNISVKLNFKTLLKSPKFFIVANRVLVDELGATHFFEKDKTHSYSITYHNEENHDGIIFYFDGSDSSPIKQGAKTMRILKAKKTSTKYTITKCEVSDIRQVYGIESEIEHSNAATEATLKQRLSMFTDGFLVAKMNGKVVGYLESVIWNPFEFSQFDEIKEFPIHFDINGSELYLIFLAVKENVRKNGIGHALLTAIEDVAMKYGIRHLKLVAKDDLISYYQKAGYNVINELPDFLENRSYTSMLMQKNLVE